MEYVLGQWLADQVGDIEPSPFASLCLVISGNVHWRTGVTRVLSCRPILPPGIVKFSHLERSPTNENVFSARFHLDDLSALENLVCPLVGLAVFDGEAAIDAYQGAPASDHVYMSDGLIREAFTVNHLVVENHHNLEPLEMGPSLAVGPVLPPMGIPNGVSVFDSHSYLLPWHPDAPSCFDTIVTDAGFNRSVVPSAMAWLSFPPGARYMRDRYVYETMIPLSPDYDNIYPFDCRLPGMTLRFLDVLTPGPWRLISSSLNDDLLHPWATAPKTDFDLVDDTPQEIQDQQEPHSVFRGHPLNGISPFHFEVFGLMYCGHNEPPPAVRVVAEGTRLLARIPDDPALGVGYAYMGDLAGETEGCGHFSPSADEYAALTDAAGLTTEANGSLVTPT